MLGEAVFMEKGIFWARRDADGKIELLTVKTPCDENGSALCPVCYTSKSGDNFNHKAEWKKAGPQRHQRTRLQRLSARAC